MHVNLDCSFFFSSPWFLFRSSSIVFDAVNRHQSPPPPMMKPSAPHLPSALGLHPPCPHDFVWVPCFNSRRRHTASTFFCFVLFSIYGAPDSPRCATGQREQIIWAQARGHLALDGPIGVYDLSWMLSRQSAHRDGFLLQMALYFFFKGPVLYRLSHLHLSSQTSSKAALHN